MTSVRFFALAGVVLLALLTYRFWLGNSGYFAVRELADDVAAQARLTAQLGDRNRALIAEVMALKQGLDAIEARARTDLGMVAGGETFYFVATPADPASPASEAP